MARKDVPLASRSNARRLRFEMTDAERKLWSAVRAHSLDGISFRRQVPMGPYIADFYCAAARLVIEVDGGQHADSVRDRVRDAWLEAHGIRTLRFWNAEVLANLEGVVLVIRSAIQSDSESK